MVIKLYLNEKRNVCRWMAAAKGDRKEREKKINDLFMDIFF